MKRAVFFEFLETKWRFSWWFEIPGFAWESFIANTVDNFNHTWGKKQNFLCHHEKWLKISGGQAQKQEIVFHMVWLPAEEGSPLVNLSVWTSSEEFLLDIQLNCAQFVDGVQLHAIADNCTHLCAFACNSNFSGGKSAKILAKNSFGEQMHTFVCTCVRLLACVHKDFFAHVCWAIDLQILSIAMTSFH